MFSSLTLSPHSFLTEFYELVQRRHVLSITRGRKPHGLTLQQSVESPSGIYYFKYVYSLEYLYRVGVAILWYVVCLASQKEN